MMKVYHTITTSLYFPKVTTTDAMYEERIAQLTVELEAALESGVYELSFPSQRLS